jgi:hypothetical protein
VTQSREIDASTHGPGEPDGTGSQRADGPDAAPRRPWWRRPWFLPAAFVSFAFIFLFVPPYLTLDPSQARLPNLRTDVAWHYPFVVAHVLFGTIAIATVPFQVWPKVRQWKPAVHRFLGRTYIFAGVIPSGLMALAIVPFSAGPAGNTVGALLWLAATIAGYRMARQRRYAEHRRYMIYSFALCLQIIEGRIMVMTIPLLPGFTPASFPLVLETASWIGIVLNLLAAQWWLERTARRKRFPAVAAT